MTVTAIIPAYNEEKTIGGVIQALAASGILAEIIVVDDGSSDATANIAETYSARVIRMKNGGKAAAMRAGAEAARSSHLLFCDADLVGFTASHVAKIIEPIQAGAAMTIGLRDRGPFWNICMKTILPKIGGERCIAHKDFSAASAGVAGFGIESALNAYCRKRGLPVALVLLPGVRHTLKETKYGLLRGFIARCKMIAEVIRAEAAYFF